MASRQFAARHVPLSAVLEESHRGLVGATGNRVCLKGHRGFESHLLRQNPSYRRVLLYTPETAHGIARTGRAGNPDFDTYLVADATATCDRFDSDGKLYRVEEIQAMILANAHEELATISQTLLDEP